MGLPAVKLTRAAALAEEEILAELVKRRRARADLVDYSRCIDIPGAPMSDDDDDPSSWVFTPIETEVAAHHIVTMQAIQRCIEKPSGRLMIFEPPGSAKSTYASVVGVTWAMGRYPGLNVLETSYAQVPIVRHSKRARQIAQSAQFRALFNTTIRKGSNAADEWELENGSRLFAAGLLGGITSVRADLGVIDDPVANREDADSEVMRRKTRQEYEDSFLTRLKPNASVILIQTRWHQDDLAGSILPEDYDGRSGEVLCRDGQVWEVLCIPAQANRADDPLGREIGEMLWPEWFNERHWAQYRINARTWSALFQQDPQPQTGGQFEESWFHRFTMAELPKELEVFGTGDWAVTKKQIGTHPDYTVLGVWGLDEAGDLWLFDGGYDQNDLPRMLAEWWRLSCAHQVGDWAIEGGPIRRAIEPVAAKMLEDLERESPDGLELWPGFTYLPHVGDKLAGVTSFRGRAQARKVHVLKGPFGDWVIAQLVGFPFGRYDDGVDMCGLAGRRLDKVANPVRDEPVSARKSPKPGTMQYLEYEDDEARRQAERYMR